MSSMPIPERIYVPKNDKDEEESSGITPAGKDPGKGHFYVSLVKSVVRIGAGVSLLFGSLLWAGVLLIVAESLGIVEEIV